MVSAGASPVPLGLRERKAYLCPYCRKWHLTTILRE